MINEVSLELDSLILLCLFKAYKALYDSYSVNCIFEGIGIGTDSSRKRQECFETEEIC